ncbi:MAG: peptide chain release factor N(5)-glutamine methyltransferase [Bacteroidales bacterium]|nr:peptide chain release factor N(5)-glutamine methyltransferase [Bacteroidales bacterium]
MKKHTVTLASLTGFIRDSIKEIYPGPEANQLAYLIVNHLLSYSKIDIHLKADERVSEDIFQQTREIVNQLIENKPIQYILGQTEFYGIKLSLNSHVLIPRQETEELVEWVIKDHINNQPAVLDIGTGSGCIAIALAKKLSGSAVHSVDISGQAIDLASENARQNQVNIRFAVYDILGNKPFPFDLKYSIIVSNPPYVTLSEKKFMKKNVTGYEPHLALYVNDHDPLVFYRKIAAFGLEHLAPGGCLYLEVNERFGEEVVKLFKDNGYQYVIIKKDINGKDRMVKATIR